MSDNVDSDLCRYFAETGELASDDAFVGQVARRILRERRRYAAMTTFVLIVVLAVVVRLALAAASAGMYVGDLPARLTASVVAFVLSPAGLVLPTLVAVLVLSLPPETQYMVSLD